MEMTAITSAKPAQADKQNETNGQLALFTGETAKLFPSKDILKDGHIVGVSYGVAKRKDVAKALNLSTKKDAAQLDREMLKITDGAKRDMLKVAAGIAASDEWTGGRLTVRKAVKTGLRSCTMRFQEVRRNEVVLTAEQIAVATGLPLEQVKARMAEQAKKTTPKEVIVAISEGKPANPVEATAAAK